MHPETRFQKAVLQTIARIVAREGRAATLIEVAKEMHRAPSTIHKHARSLVRLGLLQDSRGLQPVDARFTTGWREGVAHLGKEVERILVEHHAGEPLMKAVGAAVQDAMGMEEQR